ncbi:hypothetical protein AAFF_G00220590 [Aldrovandia affinis]|uniref:Uncharacterized protein n=1 Tax=Aldrovandia affinis TaxID=143900 RepID=A0AAD7RG38_9TELE|nr:hypothetical protein AAFF_G00220590 [Aldrovandia affinis]
MPKPHPLQTREPVRAWQRPLKTHDLNVAGPLLQHPALVPPTVPPNPFQYSEGLHACELRQALGRHQTAPPLSVIGSGTRFDEAKSSPTPPATVCFFPALSTEAVFLFLFFPTVP